MVSCVAEYPNPLPYSSVEISLTGQNNLGQYTRPCNAIRREFDCRSRGCQFNPGPVPYYREDHDHEIFSTVILLLADSRRVGVSYKQKYVHRVLINHFPANMPIWVPYGLPIWDPYGECNWVPHGSHMRDAQMGPIWVPYNSPIKKKEMI